MCGRYAVTKAVKKQKILFKTMKGLKIQITSMHIQPNSLPIIKKDDDALTLTNYHWGLVPKWSEKMQDFRPLNNARLETLMEKRTFSGLIKNKDVWFLLMDIMNGEKMKKEKSFLLSLKRA